MKVPLICLLLLSHLFLYSIPNQNPPLPPRKTPSYESFMMGPPFVLRHETPYSEHDSVLKKISKSFESGLYTAIEFLPQLILMTVVTFALQLGIKRMTGEGGW